MLLFLFFKIKIMVKGGILVDQVKIGKFIAERRKAVGLTQAQLSEKLNITDRAVSKWENGRSMPDSSIMLELCEILKITVNDLLSGEKVTMENYNEKLENNLLESVKEKERSDRQLLTLELVFGFVAVCTLLALALIAAYVEMAEWLRIVLVVIGLVPLIIFTPFAILIEQRAGYYECAKCHHKYVPSYKSVFLASHMGRTRRMKCPKCHEKSWHKKVISKD